MPASLFFSVVSFWTTVLASMVMVAPWRPVLVLIVMAAAAAAALKPGCTGAGICAISFVFVCCAFILSLLDKAHLELDTFFLKLESFSEFDLTFIEYDAIGDLVEPTMPGEI